LNSQIYLSRFIISENDESVVYFFYHMTKLLKNILNNSENRFLAKQENSFLKTQTDKTGVKRGGAMRDRTADLFATQDAS
jgi:hypothetical protein